MLTLQEELNLYIYSLTKDQNICQKTNKKIYFWEPIIGSQEIKNIKKPRS